MKTITQRVREYLINDCELLCDEYGDRTVVLNPDHIIAESLGVDTWLVTQALYALESDGQIIAEGHANYGPICTIYAVTEVSS